MEHSSKFSQVMERFRVRGLRRATSLDSLPAAAQVGHVPTTSSGSWLVGQPGSMHCRRGLLRKAVTLTMGMPQVSHSVSVASTLPVGKG